MSRMAAEKGSSLPESSAPQASLTYWSPVLWALQHLVPPSSTEMSCLHFSHVESYSALRALLSACLCASDPLTPLSEASSLPSCSPRPLCSKGFRAEWAQVREQKEGRAFRGFWPHWPFSGPRPPAAQALCSFLCWAKDCPLQAHAPLSLLEEQ